MGLETQADFARRLNVNRSHITRLKQQGRLVITDDGMIDVDASRTRIAETAGGRVDLAKKWAMQREAAMVAANSEPQRIAWAQEEIEAIGTRAQAQAKKEHYLALQAKLEYERAIGAVVPRAEVEASLEDVVTTVRSKMEQLPNRVAGKLVQRDFDSIIGILRDEVFDMMRELHKQAKAELDGLIMAKHLETEAAA